MLNLLEWQQEAYLNSKAKYNIIPAGRRTGKTKGAANAAILNAAKGMSVLWVDTIYSNIDRYYDRYFLEELRQTNVTFSWNGQKKLLKIGSGYIDFRSADRPESIEGFGYHKIYLNEAGIILNNDYLYTNAILPMLIDFKESQLFAFGTPKGKINKKGEPHKFYQLMQKVEQGSKGYIGTQLSSYDNNLLHANSIKELEDEIRTLGGDAAVQQEIYGRFVDAAQGKVYNYNDLSYFTMEEFNNELIEYTMGQIDPATSGTDSLSFPIGKCIGNKIYITDVIFSPEDTNYTQPLCVQQIKDHKPNKVYVESNGAGGIFCTNLENECTSTVFISYHQSANKHTKIIANAPFIKKHFVFRSDYEAGSDYDLYMKNLFLYNKDKKLNTKIHDDAPDSTSELSKYFQFELPGNWQ